MDIEGMIFFYSSIFLCFLQFLCALPRREGYEFFVGQWSGTELHFTALINIQVGGFCSSTIGKRPIPLWDPEPLLRLENTEYLQTPSDICCGIDEWPYLICWISLPGPIQCLEIGKDPKHVLWLLWALSCLFPKSLKHLLHVHHLTNK